MVVRKWEIKKEKHVKKIPYALLNLGYLYPKENQYFL